MNERAPSFEPVIRRARESDLPAINRIYNDEILHGVATWDTEPWSDERRTAWFAEHEADPTTPVLVAEVDTEGGAETVGFAYLSIYRPRIGYRYTRESTVYVDPRYHRRGLGRLLMEPLIEEARRLELHVLLGVIESGNVASIELHRALGYEEVSRLRDVGRKFDRWLDSVTMELLLPRPPGT